MFSSFDRRTGYFLRFLERWELLAIIRDNLKDQSKILVNKKVTDIKDGDDIATVICEDGSLFHGDLVVGADGVFSKTRAKIWELAEPENPGLVKSERNRIELYNISCHGSFTDYLKVCRRIMCASSGSPGTILSKNPR
jgi:2-polyprenyl-6-methoxyphenol hydroxylase and related FAD-dependent oxidoreductases